MKTLIDKFLFFIAVGGGLGYAPLAPGTCGSLLPLAFFYIWGGNSPWFWLTGGIFAVLSVPSATVTAKKFNARDPRRIVVDEIVGQFLALFLLPYSGWKVMLLGFLAFRFFDIVKPPPARRAEKLPWGWGIVMDDVVAGIYANVVLQIFLRWIYPYVVTHLPSALRIA